MNGPMMCQDPQTRKDCCGFCETYKSMWCKDKRGCSKRIDQEGPTMCKDPQAAKDCCALCEAYKNWTK